jgi:hypothetical protein
MKNGQSRNIGNMTHKTRNDDKRNKTIQHRKLQRSTTRTSTQISSRTTSTPTPGMTPGSREG